VEQALCFALRCVDVGGYGTASANMTVETDVLPVYTDAQDSHFSQKTRLIAEARWLAATAGRPMVADPAIPDFQHARADIRRRPRVG
jgi:hypothetical protein